MKILLSCKSLFRSLWLGVGILACLVLGTQTAKAQTVYNVIANDSGSLQDALDDSVTDATDSIINIPAGIYVTGGATFSYVANDSTNLTIQGVPGEATTTILDGETNDQVLNIQTDGIDDTGATVSISNLTLRNGDSGDDGGALEINFINANIFIESVLFQDNQAANDGGGLKLLAEGEGNVAIENSIFDTNTSGDTGGGLALRRWGDPGDVLLANNDFYNNSTDSEGGGAWVDLDDATSIGNFYNNIFYLNTVTGPLNSDLYVPNGAGGGGACATTNTFNNIIFAIEYEVEGVLVQDK